MKSKKKLRKNINLNKFHLIIHDYSNSENNVARLKDIIGSEPRSISLICNDSGDNQFLRNEKLVNTFNSLDEFLIESKDITSEDIFIISDLDKLYSNFDNILKKLQDVDADLFLGNADNQIKIVAIKFFLLKSIEWKPGVNVEEAIKDFLKKNYVETCNYKIIIEYEDKGKGQSLKNYLNISSIQGFILSLKNFFCFFKPSYSIYLRRHKFIFKEPVLYRNIFATLCILLFFLFPIMSFDAGISGDEEKHVDQAVRVYNFFATKGVDTSYMTSPYGPFQYYNITFDVFLHLIVEKFNVESVYELRHLINSYTGFFIILICSLLVAKIAGWRAAIITILLLFFSPRFLGHSFNNPKDIPFALGYIFTIYFIVKFINKLPKISIMQSLLIALGIGFTLNIRIGGLLLIPFLFLFVGLYVLINIKLKEVFTSKFKYIVSLIFVLTLVNLGGYIIGFIFWPYGLQDPINNTFEALKNMTNFQTALRQTFSGEVIWSDNVPWYYTIKYMLISIPLLVIIGSAAFIVLIVPLFKKYGFLNIFVLLFSFTFPLIYIILKESNVYGGWRHMNFTYIIMVAIAAIGINYLFFIIKSKYLKYVVMTLIVIGFYHPVIFTIKNHPYQYIYFNQFVGGVNGAYGKYETDYYYHSLKEGSEWLIENVVDKLPEDEQVIVATNHVEITRYYFRKLEDKVRVVYTRYYDRGNFDWDYAVYANSYINPVQQREGYWPPNGTIHAIRVDTVPICAIIKRITKDDYLGFQAFQNRDYNEAHRLLSQAVAADSTNEVALLNLASLYVNSGYADRAIELVNKCLTVYPDYDKALNLLGSAYFRKEEFDNALGVFNHITRVNPKYVLAYHNIGLVHARLNNLQLAVNYFNRAIEVNRRYKPSYLYLAETLQKMGRNEDAARVRQMAERLE